MRSPGETPLLLTLTPSTIADAARLTDALRQLSAEGVMFHVVKGQSGLDVTIACVHEGQLEIIIDRLKREFGVSASVSRPTVFYKETVTVPAEGEIKYARQISGRGLYAHVKLRVRPSGRGEGRRILNSVEGGAIPTRFIAPAMAGIREALEHGVLTDHPLDDVEVELYEGSYHDQDSTDAAFEVAGAMALLETARKARPVTLEPIMRVDVEVPAALEDVVRRSIASRRGQVVSRQDVGHLVSFVSRLPLAELSGFERELQVRAGSRCHVVISFADYQVLEPEDEDLDGRRASNVGAPRKPHPTRKISSIALPEPDDPYSSL